MTAWRRSSRCNSGNCLMVAHTEHHVLLRDSNDPQQRVVAVTPEEFAAFLVGAKAGEFDDMAPASPASVAPGTRPASTESHV